MEGQVRKTYLARVRGKFPAERVECREPLVQAETGVSLVDHEKGKSSHTVFELVGYDTETDTRHQIRAHLCALGFPVANDPLYGKGPLVRSRAEFLRLKQIDTDEEAARRARDAPARFVKEELRAEDLDMNCWNCRNGLLHSFRPQRIWLHAHQYQGDGWQFSAPLPAWAKDSSSAPALDTCST